MLSSRAFISPISSPTHGQARASLPTSHLVRLAPSQSSIRSRHPPRRSQLSDAVNHTPSASSDLLPRLTGSSYRPARSVHKAPPWSTEPNRTANAPPPQSTKVEHFVRQLLLCIWFPRLVYCLLPLLVISICFFFVMPARYSPRECLRRISEAKYLAEYDNCSQARHTVEWDKITAPQVVAEIFHPCDVPPKGRFRGAAAEEGI